MVNNGFMYPTQMFPQFIATHISQYGMPQVPAQTTSQAPQLLTSQAYPQGKYANHNLSNNLVDYQFLDECIRAIEGFSAYGMDAKELCLMPNVVLPQKFKVSDLKKYKRLNRPRSHITMYCRKMDSYIDNDALLIHCFQDSLFRASLGWYMGFERSKIRS